MSPTPASSRRKNSQSATVLATVPDEAVLYPFSHLTLMHCLKRKNKSKSKSASRLKHKIQGRTSRRNAKPSHPFTNIPLILPPRAPTYSNDWEFPSMEQIMSIPTLTLTPPPCRDPSAPPPITLPLSANDLTPGHSQPIPVLMLTPPPIPTPTALQPPPRPKLTGNLPLRHTLYTTWTYPHMGLLTPCHRLNTRLACTIHQCSEPKTPCRATFPPPPPTFRPHHGPPHSRFSLSSLLSPLRRAANRADDEDPLAKRFPKGRKPRWGVEMLAVGLDEDVDIGMAMGKGKMPAPVYDLRTRKGKEKKRHLSLDLTSAMGQASSALFNAPFWAEHSTSTRGSSGLRNEVHLPPIDEGSSSSSSSSSSSAGDEYYYDENSANTPAIDAQHRADCNGCKLERQLTFTALVEQVLDGQEESEEKEAQREIYGVLGTLL